MSGEEKVELEQPPMQQDAPPAGSPPPAVASPPPPAPSAEPADPYDAVCTAITAPAFVDAAQAAELVWVRIPGYPHWPAQVITPEEVARRPALQRSRTKVQAAPVIFFGEYTVGWATQKNLMTWSEGLAKGCHLREEPELRVGVSEAAAFASVSGPRLAPSGWWMDPPAPGAESAGLTPLLTYFPAAPEKKPAPKAPSKPTGAAVKPPAAPSRAGRARWSARDVLRPLVNRLRRLFPQLADEEAPSVTEDLIEWIRGYFGNAIDLNNLKGKKADDLMAEMISRQTGKTITPAQVAGCFSSAHLDLQALRSLGVDPTGWDLPLAGGPRRRAPAAPRAAPARGAAAATAAVPIYTPILTDPLAPRMPVVNGRLVVPSRMRGRPSSVVARPDGSGTETTEDVEAPVAAAKPSKDDPPSYVHVKQNVWVSRPRPKRLHKDEISVCCCFPPPPVAVLPPADSVFAALETEPMELDAAAPGEVKEEPVVAAAAAAATGEAGASKPEPMEQDLSDEALVRNIVAAIFAPYLDNIPTVEDAGAAVAAPAPAPAAAAAPPQPPAQGRASRAPRAASAGAASAFAAARGLARGSSGSLDTVPAPGPGPRDGCREGCLNRLSFIHCDPRTCPAGDRCSNRPFYQLECPGMEVFLTESKGWGVRATETIPAGSFVVEYAGEVVDDHEMKVRMEDARRREEPHFYMMEMGPGLIIDARPKGNVARLLNSSCDPNCETQKWHDAATGEVRVGIFTLRDVAPGEELVYDYHFQQLFGQSDADGEYRCRCGAAKCRGTMDATLDRAADCGKRVEVWWESDRCYYAGTITSYSAVTGKHTILYDDGEIEKLDLTQHQYRWVEGLAPAPSAAAAAAVEGVVPAVPSEAVHASSPAAVAVPAMADGAAVAMEVDAAAAVAPMPAEPLPAIAAVLGPALAAAQPVASPQRYASQNSQELAGSPGAGSPPASTGGQKRKRGRPAGPARSKMLAMTVEPAEGALPPELAATAAELLPPGVAPDALPLPALREALAPALAEAEAQVAALGTVLTSGAPESPKENGNVGAGLAAGDGTAAVSAEPKKEPTPVALAVEDAEMLDAEAEAPETAAHGGVCLKIEVVPAADGSGTEAVAVRLVVAVSPPGSPRAAVHPPHSALSPAHVLQEAQAQLYNIAVPPVIIGAAILAAPVIPDFLAQKQTSRMMASLHTLLAGTERFDDAAVQCSLAAERLGALRKFLDTATLGGEPESVIVDNPGAQAVAGRLHGNGKGGAPGRSRRTTAAAAAASPPPISGRGRRRQRKVWGDDYVDDVSDADAVAQAAGATTAAAAAPAPPAAQAQTAAAQDVASGRTRRSTRGRPPTKAAAVAAAAAAAEAAAEPAPAAAAAEPAAHAAVPMGTGDAGAGEAAPQAAEPGAAAPAAEANGAEPALQAAATEDAGAASDSQAAAEAAAATLLQQQQAAPPPAAYAPPTTFRRSGPTPGSTGLPARTILVAKRLTNSDVTKGRILLPRAAVEANLSFAIGRPHSLAAKDHLGAAWEFTLQSWANGMESRRVYVLEHAAEYIRAHALRLDDVIGISCTEGGDFLVEYNTEEVCAAAESQQAARGAGAPAPPVALPQGPSGVNPLIQHNAGRCIRSPYCNKPAGHPGFCQRTPGAGRGRRPGHAPRPPPAAPAPPVEQPLPLRRPSLEDFRRAKRMRRPSSKAISTQYRLSTEEEDAYSEGAEDSDADSDWPEEERAALAREMREIKEATPPPQMDPSVPPVFQMAADPTAPTVVPLPVPAPVHSAMRPHMPQSLMSPLRPQRQASMNAASPTGPALADLNPLPPPPLGAAAAADAVDAAMAASLMPNGTVSGIDDLLPTVPDLNLHDSLAGPGPMGDTPRGVSAAAAAGSGGDALGLAGLGGFGVPAAPPQQPQYAGPPLFGGAAPANPPGVGLPGSNGGPAVDHSGAGKGMFDFMTFLNHEIPR